MFPYDPATYTAARARRDAASRAASRALAHEPYKRKCEAQLVSGANCLTHASCLPGHYCKLGEAIDPKHFLGVQKPCVTKAGSGLTSPSKCAPVQDPASSAACTFHELCDTRSRYCDPVTKRCKNKAAQNGPCTSTEACPAGFVCGQEAMGNGLPVCRPNPAPPPPGELAGAVCGIGGKACGTGLYCTIKKEIPFETIETPFVDGLGSGLTAASNVLGISAVIDLNPPKHVPRLCLDQLHHDKKKNFQANKECETDDDCLGYCGANNVCLEPRARAAAGGACADNDCTESQYCDPFSLTCKPARAEGAGCRTHKECGAARTALFPDRAGALPMYCNYAEPGDGGAAGSCARRRLKSGTTERGCTCRSDYSLNPNACARDGGQWLKEHLLGMVGIDGSVRYSGCMPAPCDGDASGEARGFPSKCVIEPGCAGEGGDWDYCHVEAQGWETDAAGPGLCMDDEECPVGYYCELGTCTAKKGLNSACDASRECASGRCAVASFCGFFKTELESPALYKANCDSCALNTMFSDSSLEKCAIQDITVDLGWTLIEQGVQVTDTAGRGVELSASIGVGVAMLAVGPSFKMSARYGGNWMGISVGAEVSLTSPNAQAGYYTTPNAGVKSICRAGYFCPVGLEGNTNDFKDTGKYHGGSPAWKGSGVNKKDLRCGANYFCPAGSTTAEGKPIMDHTKLNNQCKKNQECPCTAVGLGKHYCGLAAKIQGGLHVLCDIGYHCEGGTRQPCEAGYFCDKEGMSKNEMEDATQKCNAGYYCPAGSTTQTGQPVIDPVVTGPTEPKRQPHKYTLPPGDTSIAIEVECHGADTTTTPANPAKDCLCQRGYYCPRGSADQKGHPVDDIITECTGVTGPAGTQSICTELSSLARRDLQKNRYTCDKDRECDCGVGHYCPQGSQSPQGRPVTTQGACIQDKDCPCDAGFYCSVGQSSSNPPTTQCLPNFYCPEGTQIDDSNKFMRNTRCKTATIPAAATFVRHALECACNYGFQCKQGSTDNEGRVTSTGGLKEKCLAGFFCQPTGEDPVKCPEGYYCVKGVAEVSETDLPKCTATHFCPKGSTEAEGHPLDEADGCPKLTKCVCAKGYYCPEGSSRNQGFPLLQSTTHIDPRVYDTDDQSTAVCASKAACKCTPGKWCGPGASADIMNGNNCAPRSFCPETSTADTGKPMKDNTLCPAGTPCPCPEGYYCKSGYGVPRECTPGHHCAARTDSPTVCATSGYYCPKTSTTSKGFPVIGGTCPARDVCKCKAGYYCPSGQGSRDDEGRPEEVVQISVDYPYPPPVVPPGDARLCAAGYFCPETSTTNKGKPDETNTLCPGTGECKCRAGRYCLERSISQAGTGTCASNFWCPKTSTSNQGKPAEASSGQVTVREETYIAGTIDVPPGVYDKVTSGNFGTVNRRRAPSCAPSTAPFCAPSTAPSCTIFFAVSPVLKPSCVLGRVFGAPSSTSSRGEQTFLADSARVCAQARAHASVCVRVLVQ